MTGDSAPGASGKSSAFLAIAVGGGIAGTLDLREAQALLFWVPCCTFLSLSHQWGFSRGQTPRLVFCRGTPPLSRLLFVPPLSTTTLFTFSPPPPPLPT